MKWNKEISLKGFGYASRSTFDGPRVWIADTGASYDLIGEEDIPAASRSGRGPLDVPVDVNTANGTLPVTDTCPIQIKVLRWVIEPIILPCVPPVLSIGQRVMSDGFDFIWRHGRNPLFITPWGQKVPMRVRNFVPHLVEEGCDFGLPSVAKSQEGLVPPATFRGSPEDSTPRQDGKDKAKSSKSDKLTSAEDKRTPSARSQTEPRAVRSQEPAITDDEDVTSDERGYRDLKAEAKSRKHLMTHEPKNPHCAACQQAKMQAKPTPDRSKRPGGDPNPEAKVFGNCITADHSIAHAERDQGLEGEATL